MNEAARSRRDDPRPQPAMELGSDVDDPLAELARLVGQDDPYRGVFKSAAAPAMPPVREQDWHADAAGAADPHRRPGHAVADGPGDEDLTEDWHDHAEPAHEAHAPADAWDDHDEAHERRAYADDERYYAAEAASHRDDAGIAEASIPDLWARGASAHDGAVPDLERAHDPERGRTRGGGSARRPLLVLGAVLILTGGGLAASLMQKSGAPGSVVASSGNGAPTILASTGPTKIKQDDSGATAPEDQDAALLNKGTGGVSGPVKVVHSEEQPADLGQLPKGGDGAASAASQSPFPEAKKVKTFVVHPDGTPLYDDGGQTAVDTTPLTPAASASAPAPLASTPKTAARGATTPPTSTIASLVADAPPVANDALPIPAAPKPARVRPIAGAATGGFGLQLAASPSEAEANAAFAKLRKKYPTELGSLSANVHQSETGGKPVYRVRVGGMSHDDANALCAKLKVGGGSCFVVHD